MMQQLPRTASRRRRRRLRLGFAPIAALSVALTAACADGPTGGDASGDQVLYIGTVNPPSSINPINVTDVAAQYALHFALDTLLEQPEPLEFAPKLADSIETTDNKTFTVKLNADAKWSDGEPIVADDVVFTFNLIAHPDSAAKGYTGNITTLEGVDGKTGKLTEGDTIPGLTAVDEHTVEFSTKSPLDPNYINEMIGTKIPILPSHTLEDIAPADFESSDYATQGPSVSSGPYKFVNYTPNTSIEYEANPDYYLGAPKISHAIMKIMPAANLAGELNTGTITMNTAGGIGNIPFQDLETVQGFQNTDTEVYPTLAFQTMEFNTAKFPDAAVRHALATAINRQQIVDELLKGNGEYIDGPYTSQSPYLDTDLDVIEYDPDAAKQALEEAGWDFSTPINFVVPTGNSVREQSADIILQNLQAIGLNVQESKYDFPTVLSMGQSGDFDLLLIGFSFNVDPDVTTLYGPGSTYNYTGWESEEATALLDQGKAEPDVDKRKEIYNRLQEIWQEEMPILTTYSDHSIAVKSKALTVGGAGQFWNGTLSNLNAWEFGSGAE